MGLVLVICEVKMRSPHAVSIARLCFSLTREQPEIHLLQDRRQRGRGAPGRGGKLDARRLSLVSFHSPAQLGTRTAVPRVFEPQQLLPVGNEGFQAARGFLRLPSLPGLAGCGVGFPPALASQGLAR